MLFKVGGMVVHVPWLQNNGVILQQIQGDLRAMWEEHFADPTETRVWKKLCYVLPDILAQREKCLECWTARTAMAGSAISLSLEYLRLQQRGDDGREQDEHGISWY